MSEVSGRNRWMLVLLTLICLIPMILGWLFIQNPSWIGNRTNYGSLVTPARPLDRSLFVGIDQFSKENIEEIRGRWVLMQVVADEGCNEQCKNSLYKTQQIRLMLNKDLMRVRRMLVVSKTIPNKIASSWWQGQDYLLRVRSNKSLFEELAAIVGQPLDAGIVFVLDPIGNLMMWYESDFDPYGLKKDLKRLLNVSQIG